MSGTAEAIYAATAVVLGTVLIAGTIAIGRHDLTPAYIIPLVWAGFWSIIMFILAGKETGKR